jgi:cysteine-rich repeat protein
MTTTGAMVCLLLGIASGCVVPPAVLPSMCGDGFVSESAREECDDQGMSSTCDIDCTLAVCGDGMVNAMAGEECDTAGSSASCDADCTVARCGDGTVNAGAGEACDDANAVSGDGCNADCRTGGACGNATLDTGEACDDGNTAAGDGCSADCRLESCGNGMLEPGETCDHGGVSTATCDSDCTPVTCGDGLVNPAAGEQCDDAGMSATCDHDCTPSGCGDGLVNTIAGEECDTAGNSDTCDDDCTIARCGDGVLNPEAGEQCDDGNQENGDGCSSVCLLECGNGVLDLGEDVDPAPGPFPSVPADALTCRYDFSSIAQLYCIDACGNWGGGDGCQQEDADVLCKLRMDNHASTAISFTVGDATAAPGICCPPPLLEDPTQAGCVPLGVLDDRGVAVPVSVHETDLLNSHGPGEVVTDVVCTDP